MSTSPDPKTAWENFCAEELSILRPILTKHGFALDDVQPHLKGERYLMQAITTTSGRKLILLGTSQDGKKVVIKASRDQAGKAELEHERTCRAILAKIDFAGEIFHTPPKIAYLKESGYVIAITEFIDQPSTFLERSLESQFMLALRAFKGQESAHATTWKHRALIQNAFGIRNVQTYLHTFATFEANIKIALPTDVTLHALMDHAEKTLRENRIIIEQYSGFLTHTDFVPHNVRIKDDTIYLLDHSSLTFGNKYEGWARFVNFMTLYNPQLESALLDYVRTNRTPEESVSLRMMRIYRLGEIIWYYVQTLDKSVGDLRTLNTARVEFWSTVLSYILKNEAVPREVIDAYTVKRDALRSEDEKRRQQGLH